MNTLIPCFVYELYHNLSSGFAYVRPEGGTSGKAIFTSLCSSAFFAEYQKIMKRTWRILWAVSLRHHMYTRQANGIIHLSVFVEQQSQEFVGQQIKSWTVSHLDRNFRPWILDPKHARLSDHGLTSSARLRCVNIKILTAVELDPWRSRIIYSWSYQEFEH